MYVATPVQERIPDRADRRQGDSWNAQKNNFGPEIGFAWNSAEFNNRLVFRGGYGLNYNQEEIAISANITANPGSDCDPTFNMSTPTSPNPGICLRSLPTRIPSPAIRRILMRREFGPNGLPTTGTTSVGIFPNTLPTMRVHHYSLDTQYDFGHGLIATVGYMGSFHVTFSSTKIRMPYPRLGLPLNPQIGGGEYWN